MIHKLTSMREDMKTIFPSKDKVITVGKKKKKNYEKKASNLIYLIYLIYLI